MVENGGSGIHFIVIFNFILVTTVLKKLWLIFCISILSIDVKVSVLRFATSGYTWAAIVC